MKFVFEIEPQNEIWRDIKGYEGFYQVSNLGNVKSLNHTVYCSDGKIMHRKGKTIIGDRGGSYFRVQLYRRGKKKRVLVHRLVAETFLDNKNNYPVVDHLNGDKSDNRVCNLEWVTVKENTVRALKNGLYVPNLVNAHKKAREVQSKKVIQVSLEGETINVFKSAAEAERHFTASHSSHISQVCRGEKNTAYGYKWKYQK